MNWFKVGDEVYLREDSQWNNGRDDNPVNTVGVIRYVYDNGEYSIDWSNGTYNVCYTDADLYWKKGSIYDKSPKDILVPFKHLVFLRGGSRYLYVGRKFIGINGYVLQTYYSNELTHDDKSLDVVSIKEVDWNASFSFHHIGGKTIWTREEYNNYTSKNKTEIESMRSQIETLQEKIKQLKEEMK